MVRRAVASTDGAEAPVLSSSAVVKVHHKSEILRFRVGWPLDTSEVLSTVSEAFTSAQRCGHAEARPCEDAAVDPGKSDDLLPIFLYHGDQGRLLELCDGNSMDFVARHTSPVHPIRLVTVKRRSPSQDFCPTERVSPDVPQTSHEVPLDEGLARSQGDSGAVISADARSDMAETPEVVDNVSSQDVGELSSSSPSTLGKEFLTTPAMESSASSSSAPPSRTGRALPAAAQRAAGALGDALEGAFEKFQKFNKTLPAPWLSQANLELQQALQASADLHMAREKSSAESRARLAKVLDKYQVRLRPVEADGNCQFRALSVQLSGGEAQHADLRTRVIQRLRDRRERYEGYMLGEFEEYLERMERDGEWGDNVTLQAASDLLSRDILVLTDRSGCELLELHPEIANEEEQLPPLCLAFLTEVHYDAVLIECE